MKSQIFDHFKLRRKDGEQELRQKLRVIRGDITVEGFGISAESMAELSSEVSVVFNSAATVRFTEPIEAAVKNNIYSIEQLIRVCDQLEKLQAIVHISTAYSNCDRRDTIREIFYESPIPAVRLSEALGKIREIEKSMGLNESSAPRQQFHTAQNYFMSLLDHFTEFCLARSDRPNTYTFTKAVSERLLLDLVSERSERYLNGKVPVAIVRPSIVGGAWQEPVRGFVDNKTGPTGALISFLDGSLQAMPGVGNFVADMVPVDMVTNAVICVAWFLANEKTPREGESKLDKISSDQGAYIFNLVSGPRNPMRWHILTDSVGKLAYKYPTKTLKRLPNPYFSRTDRLYEFWDLMNHKIPSFLIDFFNSTLLRRPMEPHKSAQASYQRVRMMADALSPFTSHQWSFEDANICALNQRLSDLDRDLFSFDVTQVDWPQYMDNYVLGTRIFAMGQRGDELLEAISQLRRQVWICMKSITID